MIVGTVATFACAPKPPPSTPTRPIGQRVLATGLVSAQELDRMLAHKARQLCARTGA